MADLHSYSYFESLTVFFFLLQVLVSILELATGLIVLRRSRKKKELGLCFVSPASSFVKDTFFPFATSDL